MMKQAIIKLVVLVILLANQVLIMFGFDPLPYDEQQVYEAVSTVLTAGFALYTFYYNQDLSKEAKEGTEYTRELKRERK